MKARKISVSNDNREKVFLEVIDELCLYTDHGLRDIADKAGCHWGTLYAWCAGKTRSPHVNKLFPVARALGFDITLTKRQGNLRLVK